MTCRFGIEVGKTLGKVVDVDTDVDDTCWGNYLRVRIEIPLNKPIVRGRTVTMKGEKLWIPFKYEQLQRICFKCCQIVCDSVCKFLEGKNNSI